MRLIIPTPLPNLCLLTALLSPAIQAENNFNDQPPLPTPSPTSSSPDPVIDFPIDNTPSDETGFISSQTAGIWYNPHHDGEGFFIHIDDEAIPPRFTATWYTFDQNGEQMWLIGSEQFDYGSNTIDVTLRRPTGTRFGHLFDSNEVSKNKWGTMTFRFNSCKEGMAIYDGITEQTGYGAGAIPMVQLADNPASRCPLFANPVDQPFYALDEPDNQPPINGLGIGPFTSNGPHEKAGVTIIKERLLMRDGRCHVEMTAKNKSGKQHAGISTGYFLYSAGQFVSTVGFTFIFDRKGQTQSETLAIPLIYQNTPTDCASYTRIEIPSIEAAAF